MNMRDSINAENLGPYEGYVRSLEAERDQLREQVKRVEDAVEVIEGTRFALPPMDASECAIVLREALRGTTP